jgi:hypothetical protein
MANNKWFNNHICSLMYNQYIQPSNNNLNMLNMARLVITKNNLNNMAILILIISPNYQKNMPRLNTEN